MPAKYALSLQGKMSAEVRLPLCPMAPGTASKLEDTLRNLKLIS